MLFRWLFAYLHLAAFGIGLAAVWGRARALQRLPNGGSLRRVFDTDAWWLLALTLWFVTGLTRAIAGLEKPAPYYGYNVLFWTKMGVFLALFIVELWPMTTILQWGFWVRKGRPFEVGVASRLAVLSYVQVGLVLLAAALAVAMARGVGVPA